MNGSSENDSASPTCYLGEVDEHYSGISALSGESAVAHWRDAERRRLIELRRTIPSEDRQKKTAALAANLRKALPLVRDKTISLYWPIRGEPDLRSWRTIIEEDGGRCCLPVVIRKNHPLAFRLWSKDTTLQRGTWGIVTPEDGEDVVPDILLAPFIGIDEEGYRLGYGGGYFDRTLASLDGPFLAIGVGFAEQRIRTIYPQPHDIPMHIVVTDKEAESVALKTSGR